MPASRSDTSTDRSADRTTVTGTCFLQRSASKPQHRSQGIQARKGNSAAAIEGRKTKENRAQVSIFFDNRCQAAGHAATTCMVWSVCDTSPILAVQQTVKFPSFKRRESGWKTSQSVVKCRQHPSRGIRSIRCVLRTVSLPVQHRVSSNASRAVVKTLAPQCTHGLSRARAHTYPIHATYHATA